MEIRQHISQCKQCPYYKKHENIEDGFVCTRTNMVLINKNAINQNCPFKNDTDKEVLKATILAISLFFNLMLILCFIFY